MAKFTKAAIMNAFIKLLNETAFDRITVKDIVDECGINRNTFYYNFDDIYDLVDEILQNEINKIVEEHRQYPSWNEGLLCAADFAMRNKKAIFHLHNSVKRNELDKYLQRVINNVISSFVETEADGIEISEEDKSFIADFYSGALLGLLTKWLDSGMKDDFISVINKTGLLFDSNIKQAIRIVAAADEK